MTPRPTRIVEKLIPYVPGEQPRDGEYIKLNTNENPYPPSPSVIEALRGEEFVRMRLYPDPICSKLRSLLAKKHDIDPVRIFVGNGSDEVLRLLFQAYLGPEDVLAMTEPTYSLYPVLAEAIGVKHASFDLDENGGLPWIPDIAKYKVFVVPNPNPPLGNFYTVAELEPLVNAAPESLFIIDEAYVDFAENDSSTLLKTCQNVVITRSFSKSYSLAGIRVGYAFGPQDIITNLYKLKDSYNVNRLSQAAAEAAVQSEEYYREISERIKKDRVFLKDELEKRGFRVSNSQGNFIFAEKDDGEILYEKLKEKKILVRFFDTPRLQSGVRITIGTRLQLESLLEAVDQSGV